MKEVNRGDKDETITEDSCNTPGKHDHMYKLSWPSRLSYFLGGLLTKSILSSC